MSEPAKLDYHQPKARPFHVLNSTAAIVLTSAAGFVAFQLIAFLLIIYSAFIRARVHLHRWPTYGNPDPKELPDSVTGNEWISVVAAGIFVGLFVLVNWRIGRSLWAIFAFVLTLTVLSGVFLFADPFGAMNWYFD